MLRTLLLVIASIWISGCQSYNARLNLPAKLERIQIKPIHSNDPLVSDLITQSLIAELSTSFIITDKNPDIIISGTVQVMSYGASSGFLTTYGSTAPTGTYFGTTSQGPSMISYAILTIETPNGFAGTIQSKHGYDDIQQFAKKITKILTKRR